MKHLWKAVLAVVALVAIGISHVDDAQAQALVTNEGRTWILFSGALTINGEVPTHNGLTITARIGDVYESRPAIVSPTEPFRYEHLLVAPSLVGLSSPDLIGSQIEFWVNGEVKSTVTNWYAMLEPCPESNSLCPVSDWWSLGIIRELDLDFPSLPGPEPMPDIAKLRVGGFAIPSTLALIVMLAGAAFVLSGICAFSRRDRVKQ